MEYTEEVRRRGCKTREGLKNGNNLRANQSGYFINKLIWHYKIAQIL